jgi:transcriptional regulator with XRE-family HTH domain
MPLSITAFTKFIQSLFQNTIDTLVTICYTKITKYNEGTVNVMNDKQREIIEFGARLRRLCEMKGVSQGELADCMGMSRPTVSKIMAGNRTVALPQHYIEVIAVRLGVSIGVLMGQDETFMDWYSAEDQELLKNKISVAAVKKALAELRTAMEMTNTVIPTERR